LKNNYYYSVKFHPDPISNDGATGFLRGRAKQKKKKKNNNNNKKKKKINTEVRSVPDPN